MYFQGNTWARVDRKALQNNISLIRSRYAQGRQILAVVKADAYGHGVLEVAKTLAEAGCDGFSVSSLLEAQELRRTGFTRPVVVMGFTPARFAPTLACQSISQCVFSLEYAQALNAAVDSCGKKLSVQLKVDSGMGRLGFDARNPDALGMEQLRQVLALPNLEFDGIFTHFSVADSGSQTDKAFTQAQFERFWRCVEELEAEGHHFKLRHCSNSAATLTLPPKGNAVRPGILLYGLTPDVSMQLPEGFQPVMSLYSTVSFVKTVDAGQSISYGRTYTAPGRRIIATVSAGYADGVPRLLSNRGRVLIRGKYAPIVGKVCMDQFCVDVTDIDGVCQGDRVTIFGPGLPVEEVAQAAETINYEILCGITKRVRRVYE